MVVGAARPTDFDEHIASLEYHDEKKPQAYHELVDDAVRKLKRLEQAATDPLFGNDKDPWWRGIPDVYGNVDGKCLVHGKVKECNAKSSTSGAGEKTNPRNTNYLMAVWCWRLVKSYDLLEFCRERIYATTVSNGKKWDDAKNYTANMKKMNDWGPYVHSMQSAVACHHLRRF